MADVSAALANWSATSASNSPSGGTSIAGGLDDNLREIQGAIVRGLSHKGSDIASATTTDLGAVEGLFHDITGTTTITGFGTVRVGIWKVLKFEGALTLTHNATSLIIPGGANITTADGDMCMVTSEGSGNWRVNWYIRASIAITVALHTMATARILGRTTASTGAIEEISIGNGLTLSAGSLAADTASDTVDGVIEIAVQSEIETGTDTVRAVPPGRLQYHPSAAKAWAIADFGGAFGASYNMTSNTDTATGRQTFTIANDLSGASYAVLATPNGNTGRFCRSVSLAAGSFEIVTNDVVPSNQDADNTSVVVFGDLP